MRRLFALILIAVPLLAADRPEATIKYRQTTMRAMAAHMSLLSQVVKKQVGRRGRIGVDAEALRGLSIGLADLFPKGTGPETARTAAKPEIWQRRSDFEIAATKLQRETAYLSQLARGNDPAAFDAQFEAVNATCNSCHDQFRERD